MTALEVLIERYELISKGIDIKSALPFKAVDYKEIQKKLIELKSILLRQQKINNNG